MTTVKQALESAIECFEQSARGFVPYEKALEQCKSALAEIEKCEPVAWTITAPDGITVDSVADYAFYSEHDAISDRDDYCCKTCNVVPLFKEPQPREWVGLSEPDIVELATNRFDSKRSFILATEAKLRELNTKG